jgi:hypothetical protein
LIGKCASARSYLAPHAQATQTEKTGSGTGQSPPAAWPEQRYQNVV